MITVGEKSKLAFHWKVNPYDYSDEKVKNIILKASKKYGVTRDSIKVIPEFIMLNEKGENIDISKDLILNIQDPNFQLQLFNEYLTINKIEDYDFDFIKKIDSEVNSKINYDVYDKFRKYSIKWIRWSNFLSYGKNNYFDFSDIKGLVLLNGEPSNQSGKTTFAIDLLHFLLFGKTSKAATQDKVFNKWLKEETEMSVEGCLDIDGEKYIIKRTLSRPQLKKRTNKSKTTQKVEYYKVVGDKYEELVEYADYQQEENSIKTNRIIKETIGNENDFDLIICATSSNLSDLIEKKDTERGRILSRWIGLLPIENKEEIAKTIFNSNINPYLLSHKYNSEELLQEREAFFLRMDDLNHEIRKYEKENVHLKETISLKEETKKALLISKEKIDESLIHIDITTLNNSIASITENGLKTKSKIEELTSLINGISVESYSDAEYDDLVAKNISKNSELTNYRMQFKDYNNKIIELEKGEICPTCGRKLEGVDNSSKIKELEAKRDEVKEKGSNCLIEIKNIVEKINSMKEMREKFMEKSKYEIQRSACQVQIERYRLELKEKNQLLNEYHKNEESIKKNNEIDLELRNCEASLENYRNNLQNNITYISNLANQIENFKKNITDIETTVEKLKEEEKVVKNWKIYLEMIGKNGISKMVLRKSLPIINAQIKHILSDVCNFNIEISITDKNEIHFDIIKDNVVADISSASGFEKTAAALALRFVLAKNSVIPKLNYVVLDEVFGMVADENLEKMKTLLDRVKDDYSSIIIVSHKSIVKEWCNTILTVTNEENISKLVQKK